MELIEFIVFLISLMVLLFISLRELLISGVEEYFWFIVIDIILIITTICKWTCYLVFLHILYKIVFNVILPLFQ